MHVEMLSLIFSDKMANKILLTFPVDHTSLILGECTLEFNFYLRQEVYTLQCRSVSNEF